VLCSEIHVSEEKIQKELLFHESQVRQTSIQRDHLEKQVHKLAVESEEAIEQVEAL
jgi:hypothetical protein